MTDELIASGDNYGDNFIAHRDALIATWLAAKAEFTLLQEAERKARDEAFRFLFPTPTEGTNRVELNRGYSMKLTYSPKYDLDKDKVEDTCDAIEELGPVAQTLLSRLVKWKPELSVTEYKKLDPADPQQMEIKALIDQILTIKPPGTAQMELEVPKVAK